MESIKYATTIPMDPKNQAAASDKKTSNAGLQTGASPGERFDM
jgi:hypothetical protein